MDRFKIDYDALIQKMVSDPNKMPLSGNEHRLIRVAFDLFRLKDGDPEDLWQVQSSDDGEFLVRTFSVPEEEKITASNWSVEMDKKEANLTISYKQIPLTRLAAKDYGAKTSEDAWLLRRVVCNKLATDAEFAKELVTSLPSEKQMALKETGILEWLAEGEDPSEKEENIDNGPLDDDEWKLAFLNLELCKTSGLFEEEQEEYEKMLAGTETEGEWFESENKLTEALEDQDTNTREAIDRAYYMIEHDLPAGSEDAAKLSELAWEVESGKKDYEELNELISELQTSYASDQRCVECEATPINIPADDVPEDYSDYFMMKCKEYGIDPNEIPSLSEEKRKELFDDIDAGWEAKSECIDPYRQMLETSLDSVLKKKAPRLLISKRHDV